MRLGILSVIAVSLLATSVARAQPDEDEPPLPPEPRQPLPSATGESMHSSGPALPAWQSLPGGYGGWHDGMYGGGGCGSCCGSCDSCCRSCRPGLMFRLKALKCKLCARWACRRSRRSCCGSCDSCCGSDCCTSDMPPHGMPTAPSQSDLLPVPPAEAAPYSDDDDEMPEEAPHRAASSRTSVKKQHYSMPRVASASKPTIKAKKKVSKRPID